MRFKARIHQEKKKVLKKVEISFIKKMKKKKIYYMKPQRCMKP